jgi:hypothetical protein
MGAGLRARRGCSRAEEVIGCHGAPWSGQGMVAAGGGWGRGWRPVVVVGGEPSHHHGGYP